MARQQSVFALVARGCLRRTMESRVLPWQPKRRLRVKPKTGRDRLQPKHRVTGKQGTLVAKQDAMAEAWAKQAMDGWRRRSLEADGECIW